MENTISVVNERLSVTVIDDKVFCDPKVDMNELSVYVALCYLGQLYGTRQVIFSNHEISYHAKATILEVQLAMIGLESKGYIKDGVIE